MGGISWETLESTIADYFGGFGELQECVLMTNKVRHPAVSVQADLVVSSSI